MWNLESARRVRILAIFVFAVVALLIFRLAWLQLFHGPQYKEIAEDNRLHRLYHQAPRGTMYDRNGIPLVSNRPSFAISVIPAECSDPAGVTGFLADLAGLTPAEVAAMLAAGRQTPYTPVRVILDADPVMLTKVQERKTPLPGVIIEAVPVRHYVQGAAGAHVYGYIGRISAEEYAARRGEGYSPNDLIGKDGLELVWENVLRGRAVARGQVLQPGHGHGGRARRAGARAGRVGCPGAPAHAPGRAHRGGRRGGG